ncbi:ExeM/NucH family extracellular endonuclease [Okibacterium endophyticum]
MAPLSAMPAMASPDGTGVVINEAYLSGGSSGAAFTNKFVELYNPGPDPIDLSGMSVQYRAATSSGASTTVVTLSGEIASGGYYLVQGSSNGGDGAVLPTPDAAGNLNLSGTKGTVALVEATSAVTLPVGSATGDSTVVDLLGYGASNTFEGSAAVGPTGTTDVKSLNRTDFADTDDNAADFTLSATITPQSSGQEPGGEPGEPTEASIAEVQGTTGTSPFAGKDVITSGIVTATYPEGGFRGYYIQTPGTGGALDPARTASDAVFVFSDSTVGSVAVGDYVQVTGTVVEFNGLTELSVGTAESLVQLDTSTVTAPEPVIAAFPETDAEREALEGMLIAPQGDYTITDTYDTNKYAQIALAASDMPLVTPTALGDPGSAEYAAAQARTESELVVLDDGASIDFLPAGGGDNQDIPIPYISNEEPIRVGASATFTKPVVLDYRNDTWKFQPTSQLTTENAATVQPATFENDRPAAPDIDGGDVRLATFNVLNYFATTGDQLTGCNYYTDRDGNPIAVSGGCEARGAANAENLQRQQDKIVTAINLLDANVVSLEEIENSAAFGTDRDLALSTLVDALNDDLGTDEWAYVPSPATLPADEDVIRTAFIYKPESIETVGTSSILDTANFGNARQPNAQAFKPAGGSDDDTFVVIANHLKSKGSGDGATGDNVDTGDGAGAWNGDRTRQATDLVAFADQMKTEHNTDRVFLVGDFNSYAAEDPIDVIVGAGYIDEGAKSGKHSYSYGGSVGSLDYIFASPEADAMVADSDIWNINSGESVALEYSRYNYNATNFYVADQYRSSDHDPVIVGLDLDGAAEPVTKELNLLNINDFHGRIDENTVKFAGTVEQLKADYPGSSAFLSAGDNIGASLFASSSQDDIPTLDVLNALSLEASAVGNHEFDKGYEDLAGRVTDAADFSYLAANVYIDGETIFDEYTLIDIDGVTVGIIGAVTEETPSLVSPGGIEGLEFGDPVEAVNRVADELSDGDPSNGEADVLVAEYHAGAGAGTPDGASLDEEIAAGGAFADIVTKTSAVVDAIFTGHTHKQYAWDAAIPGEDGTRPVLQTGSYGEFIGQIVLEYNTETGEVTTAVNRNVPRLTEDEVDDAELVNEYPAVAEVKTIVDAALAQAKEIGGVVIGNATADITTAYAGGKRDDRSSESTLGNFVADALVSSLSSPERGGAEIGVVNPGGLRDELFAGDITYAEANAVLPFVNNLWTTTLTGAQFKTVLEQQWQRKADGTVPDKPYLQLGLSNNVSYTYDPTRDEGDRITSITVNGEPIDPARGYRVGSFNFLLLGGDNFREFANGTDTRDSGLVDRDAWVDYIETNSPISPSYERRSVQVTGLPEGPVSEGDEISLQFAKLDLTSLGVPANTELTASLDGQQIATAPVTGGEATLSFTVPEEGADPTAFATALASGSSMLTVVASPTGTTVSVPLEVTPAQVPSPEEPGDNGSAVDGAGTGSAAGGAGSLPETGAEMAPQVFLALMLIVAGAASALVARRGRVVRRS